MKVLIACEFSGIVREAFRKHGHDAWSCDLLPTEQEGPHIKDDILKHLNKNWDLMISHPPCTFLTVTGNKWFKPEYAERFPNRKKDREEAIKFFLTLAQADIPRICVENPVGIMSTIFRKPDQSIQPFHFGHSEPKKTCLWLKNLPLLKPTNMVEAGEYYEYKSGKRVAKWYADLVSLPKEQRTLARSRTFKGIADAMAEQWGAL